MSRRNPVNDYEFGVPKGLDTTSPIATVREGFVRQAKNANVGYSGGYTKRMGFLDQITVPGNIDNLTIPFGIEYRSGAGVRRTIVFGTNGGGGGGRYGQLIGGTYTDISTGKSGAVRPSFAQFETLLFFYNGVDNPELYDGTATRQVGIDAPTNEPTGVAGGSGDLSAGDYQAAYTYYNSVTGAESTPSPVSASVTATGGDSITWTVVAGDATTADTIRIYRTVANGNVLFLDAEASIGSTAVISNQADAALGRQIELDNTRIVQLSTTAKYITIADNRIFLRTGPNEIRFSKIGQEGPMPESFEVKSVVPTTGKFGENDRIVGVNRISQLPIVLKEQSIGRLDPVGIPDNTQAIDNVSYEYREISDAVGAVSHFAACQVLGELIFMGRDNIYATNGIQVRPIADAIQATIRGLGFTATQVERMSAINDAENRRIMIQIFSSSTATQPDMTIVGDYQMYPEFRWTTYEKGEDVLVHPGVRAASFFHVTNTSTGKLDVWFGNTDVNGEAYKMNTGNSDNGDPIWFQITTRPYFGNAPINNKLFKKGTVQAKGDGADYGLMICSIFDLTGQIEDCRELSLFANAALYDDATSLYDTSLYADEAIRTLEYDLHRKAHYLQLVFKQTEADAPIDLFGWAVEASGFNLYQQND